MIAIFVNFSQRIFLEGTVVITSKVVNRPNKKINVSSSLNFNFFQLFSHKRVVYLLKLELHLKTSNTQIRNFLYRMFL